MRTILLTFTITLKPGMALTRMTVHATTLYQDELDAFKQPDDENVLKGSITIKTALSSVLFDISGVGNAVFESGSFNFKIGTRKVFEEDQPLDVKGNGKISYINAKVKLPL